ncbi:MAG: YlmC/YmxH family sporulation protein [Eubacteriales bacterium]|nr:YlmC/YmxH family sporulation protein [Eubacteriales bacterium]
MQDLSHGPCCRIVDLRCKEVISICDGSRLGYVNDVEIDTCTGRLVAIVVPGRPRLGLLGRREDFVIPWDAIRRIGDDIILTSFSPRDRCERKEHGRESFFKK